MNKISKTYTKHFSIRILYLMSIALLLACKDDDKDEDVRPSYAGAYVGTMKGVIFRDFQKPSDVHFSETAEFIVIDDGREGSIAGFDSVPARLEFDKMSFSTFGISDNRSTADLRINASGNFSADTLRMSGRYIFLDGLIRQFEFMGIKK